jgi:DNA-binding MarR family transcriptional regulator
MSDIESVISGYRRIRFACRARETVDASTGARLSSHQANLLGHLDAVDPSMVSELAEHVGVTLSTMSLTLKRLEAAGLVRRDRDPVDRRVTNVRLTETGVRLRDARSILDRHRVDRMLRMLDPERRREALRGLAVLADAADSLLALGSVYVEALAVGEEE